MTTSPSDEYIVDPDTCQCAHHRHDHKGSMDSCTVCNCGEFSPETEE